MADGISTSDLRNTWNSAADGWAKWEHVISTGLSEATEVLLDMADAGPGMRVLDLACGAGSQTIAAAKRVGPSGSVVAVDIAPTMLEHVRRNAARAGLQNIETVECAAENLDETLAPFDASISRVGLMLFASPSSAVAAVERVLKPGARFAAMVFTTPANNLFTAQPMAILLRHAGKPPPVPGQPGLFALGGPDVLASLMTGSGLTDVATKTVRATLSLPNASDALEMMQEAFGAYRVVVAELSDTERSRAWGEVHECLKQFESGGRFEAEAEFIIGSGAKPG